MLKFSKLALFGFEPDFSLKMILLLDNILKTLCGVSERES